MIVSKTSSEYSKEFEGLLSNTTISLKESKSKLSNISPSQFEKKVYQEMVKKSINTSFENEIELFAGKKFPDIIVGQHNYHYGVEVKSTIKDKWHTLGNSVFEGTRVDGVEHIYFVFGKLGEPIDFRYRKYEDCLSGIAVTHSPRYLVDLELKEGETIFDKLHIRYDELRKMDDPIIPIRNYYRSQLKDGQSLWWISEIGEGSDIIIKMWSSLTKAKKNYLRAKSMVLFPEIFGNSGHKFTHLATWLVTKESIINPSLRDPFTAGGSESRTVKGKKYTVSRIVCNLLDNLDSISTIFKEKEIIGEIEEIWDIEVTPESISELWISKVVDYLSSNPRHDNKYPLREILEKSLKR